MKKLFLYIFSSILMIMLSACGSDTTGADSSTTNSNYGSSNNSGSSNNMTTADNLSISDGMAVDSYQTDDSQTYDRDSNSDNSSNDRDSGGGNKNSANNKKEEGKSSQDDSDSGNQNNVQNRIGALNDSDPMLYGNDDEEDSGSGSNRYILLGDVIVTIKDEQPFALHTAADKSHIIAPPYQKLNPQGSHVIYISGYSIVEDRLNEDAGSIMFKFTMPDVTVTGCYPLEYPLNNGAQVCVENVQTLNGSKRVLLEGYIQDAQMYTDDTQTSTFTGSVQFKTQVIALQQD